MHVSLPLRVIRALKEYHSGQVAFPVAKNVKLLVRLAQGKQNLRVTCPEGKLGGRFFSSPACERGNKLNTSLFPQKLSFSAFCANLYLDCYWLFICDSQWAFFNNNFVFIFSLCQVLLHIIT